MRVKVFERNNINVYKSMIIKLGWKRKKKVYFFFVYTKLLGK